MGFKIKHVFRGPQKVVREIGKVGILGNDKNGNFRVVGIKVGKDLVPIVKVATVVAATAVGGPALGQAVGVSAPVAAAVTGAAANGVVTAASGGSDSQVARAVIAGGISGAVAPQIASLPSVPAQVVASATSGAVIAGVSGGNPVAGAISGAVGSVLPNVSDNAYIDAAGKGAILGAGEAIVNNEKVIKGALTEAGCQVVATGIRELASKEQRLDIEEKKLEAKNSDLHPEGDIKGDIKDSKLSIKESNLYTKEIISKESALDIKEVPKSSIKVLQSGSDQSRDICVPALSEEFVTNIKVARRGLHYGGITWPHIGEFAHSAVIITTNKTEKYLMEFMDDSKVVTTKLDDSNFKITDKHESYVNARININNIEDSWTVEQQGCAPNGPLNLEQAREIMGGKYNFSINGFLFHGDPDYDVCHTAQERLRDAVCDQPITKTCDKIPNNHLEIMSSL